jgi:hypothetical protein
MITITQNKFIPVDPLPKEVIHELYDILNSGKNVTIAGVEWALENMSISPGGMTISLYRPGSKYLEQIAHEGIHLRNNPNDTMQVSANTLAAMLGLKKDTKEKED